MKNWGAIAVVIILAALLYGWINFIVLHFPPPLLPLDQHQAAAQVLDPLYKPAEERFTVMRIQVVKDDATREGYRSIYLIHDNKTGTEFFGVSGIGMFELHEHPAVTVHLDKP